MKIEDNHRIQELKSKSFQEIDHLSILQDLYDQFNEGNNEYYLLARYFVNGIEDLAKLKEKSLWKLSEFEKHRNLLYNNHDELINIIETYYELDEDEVLIQKFYQNGTLKMIWIEKEGVQNGVFRRYFDNTLIAVESNFQNGKRNGEVKEWYPNGKQLEIGKYVEGEYIVEQFWDEKGNQLLINGSGKTIRNYGTNDDTVYEQYFENYEFKKRKETQRRNSWQIQTKKQRDITSDDDVKLAIAKSATYRQFVLSKRRK